MRHCLRLVLCGLCGIGWLKAASPEPVDPLRLTRVVEPVAESVQLNLDPAQDDYTGRVRIDVVVHEATSSFRLHALGPVLHEIVLTDSANRSTPLTAATTEAKLGIVTLTASAPLVPGSYTLSIGFSAKFSRDGLGLYKTLSRGDAYLFTQFEDTQARRAFPCWDEPSFKIPWQLTLSVPAALDAVTNSAVAFETRTGDTKTITYGRTPPMPAYIVALAVGPLEFVPVPGTTVPARIITPRGQAAYAAEAVKLAPALLRALEQYFGIPYPYAKLDQIAVPEYVYGAMENAGLITFVDRALLMDPAQPPFTTRRRLANVMAHEMAHMWFGDLVTMKWWDDLWLNESFADWMCAKIVQQVHPEMRLELSEVENRQIAMRADALPSVLPIRRHLLASDDMDQMSPELIYNKGKAILSMVEGWIGAEKFRAAMQLYFARHRWGNTSADDLWAAFDAASGQDISAMLAAFIEKPGMPLVTFALLPDGQLQLTQRRFISLGGDAAEGRWQVPVTFTWSARGQIHHEQVLLKEAARTVNIPRLAEADWVYPNTNESGYYRWSLPPALNARLASRASSVLGTGERLGLLGNASALLDAGLLGGADYLAYLAAFAEDPEPEVVTRVISGLQRIHDVFIRPEQTTAFNAMREAMLRPALDRIGLQPRPDEPPHLAPSRSALIKALGHQGAVPDVLAAARENTQRFLADPTSLDATLAEASLGVAAYHGDAALFDSFTGVLEKTKNPAARSSLLGALGDFHDRALVTRALGYALSEKLYPTEFTRVLISLAGDPDNRAFVVDWMMQHYAEIQSRAPAPRLPGLITAAGLDRAVFERFRDFLLDPSRKEQAVALNVVKAADRVALAGQLRAKESASVAACLRTFPGKISSDSKK